MLKLARKLVKSTQLQKYCTTLNKMAYDDGRGVKINDVISVLEKFAPKSLSESWDNTGLLIEPFTARNINKILLANDLTEDVAFEAQQHDYEMIICYHPPIFSPLKSINQRTWKGQILSLLLEYRIYLYSPHTSWDSVKGGVNDWLATAFPYVESVPIIPHEDPNTGAGRLLQITNDFTVSEAIEKVKTLTGLKYVRVAIARRKTITSPIKSVALCAGSGTSVLKNVKADLFLTGEMLHHDILDATQRGISVILTNHSDSERGFLRGFSLYLQKQLKNKAAVSVSGCDKDPLTTV